jgi:hypothetical protein
MWKAICTGLVSACALAGCGTASNQLLGVPPTLQQSSLLADAPLQDRMVDALIEKAGFPRGTYIPPGSSQWKFVAQAGLFEVDLVCDRYLASLFAFNREQRAGRQILTAAGAGTAAIMGITGAPGVSVALVAAAFGLAANVFDAGVNSVLFTISPTAVRAIAAKGRQVYVANIKWETVNSRPMMMSVVQTYLSQCTPAAIEANIDNAATGAPSVASSDARIALQAAMAAAPSSSVAQSAVTFNSEPVNPGGTATPLHPPPSELARNVADGERPFIESLAQAERLQRALGVKADGDLGPAGTNGETRMAIAQFRGGPMRRTGNHATTPSDLVDDTLNTTLIKAGPMPTVFKSPFERGLLGNQLPDGTTPAYKVVDGDALEFVIAKLTGKTQTQKASADPTDRVKVMRDAIVDYRKANKIPAADAAHENVLDMALFDDALTKAEASMPIVRPGDPVPKSGNPAQK